MSSFNYLLIFDKMIHTGTYTGVLFTTVFWTWWLGTAVWGGRERVTHGIYSVACNFAVNIWLPPFKHVLY